MVQEKIKTILQKTKREIFETFRLLWCFKWYIAFDIIFFVLLALEYFNPPAADNPIWKSEVMSGIWNYPSQQLYITSSQYGLIISALFFVILTSNMRNHPLLAKIAFLFPLYIGWVGLL